MSMVSLGTYRYFLSSRPIVSLNHVHSIGPVDLTEGTIGEKTPVPTVTDSLLQQGTIATESIGIFYEPSTSATAVANGELTFGSIDSSKCAQLFVHLVLREAEGVIKGLSVK